jgi:hypothetical protein
MGKLREEGEITLQPIYDLFPDTGKENSISFRYFHRKNNMGRNKIH